MATNITDPKPVADQGWFIATRWQEFEGERRANYIITYLIYGWFTEGVGP